MSATLIILETRTVTGSEYRVKILERFASFDWSQPDWDKRRDIYDEWLARLFAKEEPFAEFDAAANYAVYLALEYEEEFHSSPGVEIITIHRKGN